MINLFTKKTISFLLSILFMVVGFGFFANVASAAHEPIATTLERDYFSIPLGTLSYPITEIDDALYTNIDPPVLDAMGVPADYPKNPNQVAKVLTNIKNDGPVVSALQLYRNADAKFLGAQNNCQYYTGKADCTGILGFGSSEAQNASNALDSAIAQRDAAIDKLSLATMAARERQQDLINGYVTQNNAENLAVSTANGINAQGTAATNAITGLNTTDVGNASADASSGAPSTEVQNAKRQELEAVNAWISSDPLAVTMQQQCSLGVLPGTSMNLTPCFANIAYQIIYRPAMYALMGSAYIFDKMLNLSIDSTFVNQGFVSSSWTVIRDFSNMLFIFILLYTGIMTIFGAADWRKTVLQVVIIALLINFSLFFTKVVIDAGNVLAVGVKSAISSGYSISEGIAAGFSPQQFITVAAKGSPSGGDAIIVFLVAAVVSGFAAWLFLKAALLFMGRLIAFWFLMIFSPFAFISTALPMGNKFHSWFGTLMSQAFVAPVYLFFIYLIMKVISADNGILSTISSSGTTSNVGSGWFSSLIVPVIVATLIIVALQKALAFATEMSGDFGSIGSDALGKVMGVASVVGTGGIGVTGLAGRAIGGRIAQNLQDRGTFQKMATDESKGALSRFAGRQLLNINEKARTGTWDARGVGVVQTASKAVGLNLGKPGEAAKGGFAAAMKKQDQADKKFAERLAMTDTEKSKMKGDTAKRAEQAKEAAEERKATRTSLEKEYANAQETHNKAPSAGAVSVAKTNYEAAVRGGNQEIINAAKETLEKAETTHAAAPSSMAVQSTLAKLEAMKEAEKKAAEEVEAANEAVKAAEKEVSKEEGRRRGVYADYVEGRREFATKTAGGVVGGLAGVAGAVVGGLPGAAAGASAGYAAGAGLYGYTYSHAQAQRTADALRKGGDKAKAEGKDKVVELVEKMVKEQMEKDKSAGH